MATMEKFDAIVVGSGFGGSVMAFELANAGLKVCLLERGKSYPPGSFPRSPRGMAQNFWDPSKGHYGLFNAWSFQSSEVLISSGLGGGSLIYANVLLRKPVDWFRETRPDGTFKPWPVTRSDLDPHYDEVEKVLNGQKYPLDFPPYNQTHKTLAFRDSATSLGYDWSLPKLAVSFRSQPGKDPVPGEPIVEPFPNLHDRTRWTCRLCGECDVGCNYGSKNTLDYNYLTLAQRKGAQIRPLCEVRQIRPRSGGGYEVDYVNHDPQNWEGRERDTHNQPLTTIAADRLILSAGTLGSTFLLLKNRKAFPKISDQLGTRYSTNGDLLTFAFTCKNKKDGQPLRIDPSTGPVITSTVEVSLGENGGYFIQDAGYPEFLGWLLETSDAPGWIMRVLKFVWRRFTQIMGGDPQTEIDGQLSQLIGNGTLSSTTMTLLGMGRDVASGTMSLRQAKQSKVEYLENNWSDTDSGKYFDAVTESSRKIADAMGGDFVENPDTKYLRRLISVHPLGGCPMGVDEKDGVVDSYGQVFNYPGLYVADGSVMPGAVGSNPSLTIAALSRRFALNLIEQHKKWGTATQ